MSLDFNPLIVSLQIDHDFDIVHPGKGNLLFQKWDLLRESIINFAKRQCFRKDFMLTLKSFNIDLDCFSKSALFARYISTPESKDT